jgi:hypothetical protein
MAAGSAKNDIIPCIAHVPRYGDGSAPAWRAATHSLITRIGRQ